MERGKETIIKNPQNRKQISFGKEPRFTSFMTGVLRRLLLLGESFLLLRGRVLRLTVKRREGQADKTATLPFKKEEREKERYLWTGQDALLLQSILSSKRDRSQSSHFFSQERQRILFPSRKLKTCLYVFGKVEQPPPLKLLRIFARKRLGIFPTDIDNFPFKVSPSDE